MTLKIAVAQLNFTVGDVAGNARRIVEAARAAHADGARLLLTPELAVCGGLAGDLFLRPSFIAACDEAVRFIARETAGLQDMVIVAGHPVDSSGPAASAASAGAARLRNAASVIGAGRVIATCAKRLLPGCQASDERRYFTPGQGACVFEAAGARVGLLIGQDASAPQPANEAKQAGAELLAVIDAWPFHAGPSREREALLGERARACGLPLVYANLVGGQDDAVFDGHSLALNAGGQLAGRAAGFAEQPFTVQATRQNAGLQLTAATAPAPEPDAELWDALVLGLRDYVHKSGFSSVVLGLSGGIDSALVLALAVDALGRERVSTVMMPSPYTAGISVHDAREMAGRLGVRHAEIDILPAFECLKHSLAPLFGGKPEDATEENLQARIRGAMLMALSNKHGSLLLSTGNKSETAAGYCTLYGDMCGGFAPINDLLKTTVFRLARWRNAHDPHGRGANPIPERIITRPPSAELRAGQTDQDSLPPYETLDALIDRAMQGHLSAAELAARGFNPQDAGRVAGLMKASQFKRQQAALGTRVTRQSFGKDWRYPIVNQFRD